MALTDSNQSRPLGPTAAAGAGSSGLARLPRLHAELSETAALARFVRSAPRTAMGLVSMCLVSLLAAGGLEQKAIWAGLVLIGAAAMLRVFLRTDSGTLACISLREAARDLRAICFYAGFSWGAGAFLLLGHDPAPIMGLCFAALPSTLVALVLEDCAAGLAFVAPVTLFSAAAIILRPWGQEAITLAMLLLVQGFILAGLFLPAWTRRPPAEHADMVFPVE